jgi:hypothetical protein
MTIVKINNDWECSFPRYEKVQEITYDYCIDYLWQNVCLQHL